VQIMMDETVPGSARLTYAVGDIHGRVDLLKSAVEAVTEHARSRPFRLVFLGDYVDRGPDSRRVIELLMGLQRVSPVVCLKGNHEQLMLKAVVERADGALQLWLDNGGEATLRSYGLPSDPDAAGGVPSEHIRWLSSLPLTTGDAHRIYVHAGLMPRTATHRQKEETCLWIREKFLQAQPGDFEAHVVHGHTPLWEGKPDPARPELLEHRTNLDTGAFATGVLSVGVFDAETPGGPVELLRIVGRPMHHLVIDTVDAPEAPTERRRSRLGRLARYLRGASGA
jgi:serine/threonine protein phosphatase 1